MYQTRHLHHARWIVQIENSPPYFDSQYTKLDINKFVFIDPTVSKCFAIAKKGNLFSKRQLQQIFYLKNFSVSLKIGVIKNICYAVTTNPETHPLILDYHFL